MNFRPRQICSGKIQKNNRIYRSKYPRLVFCSGKALHQWHALVTTVRLYQMSSAVTPKHCSGSEAVSRQTPLTYGWDGHGWGTNNKSLWFFFFFLLNAYFTNLKHCSSGERRGETKRKKFPKNSSKDCAPWCRTGCDYCTCQEC